MRPSKANEDQIRKFLSYLLVPGESCVELRVFGASWERNYVTKSERYTATVGGIFDDLDAIVLAAEKCRGVSMYITVNPVSLELLKTSTINKLHGMKRGEGVKDEDITRRRWLFLDFDAKRRPDTSATDEQLQLALNARDALLASQPEIAASSIWGCSGNGGYNLLRVDLPNDDTSYNLIADALKIVAHLAKADGVEVDLKTKNASRVMCLAGTEKCKGSDRPDAPWRMATIDSPDGEREVFDLAAWVASHAELLKSLQGPPIAPPEARRITLNSHGLPNVTRGAELPSRIRSMMGKIGPAVSGQHGHDKTFDVACSLVHGFGLSIGEAKIYLDEHNAICQPPWSEAELYHKLEQAEARHDGRPRGHLLEASHNGNGHAHATAANLAGVTVEVNGHATQSPARGPSEPLEELPFTDIGNAIRLVNRHGHEIRWCDAYGAFLIYDGSRWAHDATMRVAGFAHELAGIILAEMPPTKSEEVVKQYQAWASKSQMSERLNAAITCSKARPGVPITPKDLDRDPMTLNVMNGTVNLRDGTFGPHKPKDLITKLAPVYYDPEATCPTWMKFLREIFSDDWEMMRYIQRVIGYATSGEIREHGIWFLYGSGANGKGTFVGTIAKILGDYYNEVSTDLFMADSFEKHPTGLTELEGRRFVVADEIEDGKRISEATIKKLTGGSPVQARKMGKDFYTFDPSAKLFITTNHKPDIRYVDAALWRRLKLVPFLRSFDPTIDPTAKPDLFLSDKLRAEASGILNWMLAGCLEWQRFGLAEPDVVKEATKDYKQEADIIGTWIATQCRQVSEARTVLESLYANYRIWCEGTGHKPFASRRFSALLTEKGHETQKSNSLVFKIGIRIKTTQEKDMEREQANREMGNESVVDESDNEDWTKNV